MTRYLPGRIELVLLVLVSIACAAIVAQMDARDTGLALLTFPLFILAAIRGLQSRSRGRRSE